LETTITPVHESVSEIKITLTPEEYAGSLEKSINDEMKKISLPGFRKGKVPKATIEKLYGESLRYQAAEKVATDTFYKHVEDNKIYVYGTPKITEFDFKPEADLVFTVQYEHTPNLVLRQYKGIEIEVDDLEVTDKMVDEEIKRILNAKATKEPCDAVDSEECVVSVELVRSSEPSAHPEHAHDHEDAKPFPIDVNLTNDGVNENLRTVLKGKKVGDPFEFSFEDKHHHHQEDGTEEEHVETIAYKGTVKSINKLIFPEMTEEFVKTESNQKASTEAELRELIRGEFKNYFDNQIEDMIRMKLDDKLVELNDFTPPAALVKHYHEQVVESRLKEQKEQKSQGRQYSKAELEKVMQEPALRFVKLYFIEEAIIKEEKIEVTDATIEAFAKENAEKFNAPIETLMNLYQGEEFKKDFLKKEFYEFLKRNANIKKVVRNTEAE
jgi:trigger factor